MYNLVEMLSPYCQTYSSNRVRQIQHLIKNIPFTNASILTK